MRSANLHAIVGVSEILKSFILVCSVVGHFGRTKEKRGEGNSVYQSA